MLIFCLLTEHIYEYLRGISKLQDSSVLLLWILTELCHSRLRSFFSLFLEVRVGFMVLRKTSYLFDRSCLSLSRSFCLFCLLSRRFSWWIHMFRLLLGHLYLLCWGFSLATSEIRPLCISWSSQILHILLFCQLQLCKRQSKVDRDQVVFSIHFESGFWLLHYQWSIRSYPIWLRSQLCLEGVVSSIFSDICFQSLSCICWRSHRELWCCWKLLSFTFLLKIFEERWL